MTPFWNSWAISQTSGVVAWNSAGAAWISGAFLVSLPVWRQSLGTSQWGMSEWPISQAVELSVADSNTVGIPFQRVVSSSVRDHFLSSKIAGIVHPPYSSARLVGFFCVILPVVGLISTIPLVGQYHQHTSMTSSWPPQLVGWRVY